MNGQTVINKQQQFSTSLEHDFLKEWLDTYVLHTYFLLASSANSADGEIFI
jgi:hypothetical protein